MSSICCVCQDQFKYPITLKCNHTYCFFCIKSVKETIGVCPLCRDDITDDLSAISMAKFNMIPTQITCNAVYPCVKWLYGSNDQKTWWYYDDSISEQIEKFYYDWNNKKETDKDDSEDSEDSEDSDDSADSEDNKYPEIQIGPYAYELNFHDMLQIRGVKQRRMLRKEFNSEDEKSIFDKTVRGIIGIKF